MLTKYAAILASIILFSVLCFQILLILGKPLGEYAWGGKYKVLPTKLRVSSVISSIIYILCALIILENAGLVTLFKNKGFLRAGIWFLTGFFALGMIMNFMSRSKKEKMIMTPVVSLLAVMCLIIAIQ